MKTARVLMAVAALLLASCAFAKTAPLDVDVVGRTLPDLVRGSDLVVVGSVLGEAGTANFARDPNDITRPHPTTESIAQLYRVRIEEALKGGPKGEITVAVSRWSRTVGKDGRVDWPQFIPFEAGQRYALFLRLVPQPMGPYFVVAEPGRFKVGPQVVVQSPWRHASEVFPARDAGNFMADLHAAAVGRP